MKPRSATLIALVVAVVAATAIGIFVVPGGVASQLDRHYTDNAYVRGDVTQISPKVSGHVVQVAVRDNEPVKAGDVLFRIDDRDYQARLAQAQAAVSARKAAVGNLDAQLGQQRSAILQAQAGEREAQAGSEHASDDASRARQLVGDQLISVSQLDQLVSAERIALAHVAATQANVAASQQRIAVLESQRPQLLADIRAAEAVVALAQLDVESTVVRAPVDGRVSERVARVGQYVKAGTQLIALVPTELWVVANFKETQLQGMRTGASVDIVVDAVPGTTFEGRLDSLSPASGAQFALLPPDNATGNFTRIVQRIPVRIALLPRPELADLRPGMSATVQVRDEPVTTAGGPG